MRHHDREAAVFGRHGREAALGAVRVVRIDLGRVAARINEAGGGLHERGVFRTQELHAAFAVGVHDGHHAAGHAREEDRRALENLDVHETGLELLGRVAHEFRPVRGARDQVAQMAHHLAAVADAQTEGVLAVEERAEHLDHAVVVKDGLGPAAAGAEHVAVGEAAAAGKARELGEVGAAREEVRHVNVIGVEAGARERSGHFRLGVDALFAQDGDLRTHAREDHRSGDVFIDVEGRLCEEAGVLLALDAGELAVGAGGIVAAAGDLPGDFRPGLLEVSTVESGEFGTVGADRERIVVDDFTHEVADGGKTGFAHHFGHAGGLLGRHLHQAAELFVEESGEDVGVLREGRQVELHAEAGGEHHFGGRGGETAVGTVVVGHDGAFIDERAQRAHEAGEHGGILAVGRRIAEALGNLGEDGAAHAGAAAAEVRKHEHRRDLPEFGRKRERHVADGSCGGGDERDGARHGLLLAVVLPGGAHGERVLAHGHGDAERNAEVARALDGVKELGVLALGAAGSHPVEGELDFGELHVGGGDVGERFAHGHAARSSGIDHGDRGAFAHRHGFAAVRFKAERGHAAVGDRHLPGADHLVAGDEAAHGAVADGDEEGLGTDGRVTQDVRDSLCEIEPFALEGGKLRFDVGDVAVHARGLAEENFHRHVDGRGLFGTRELEVGLLGDRTEDGERAALAFAEVAEDVDLGGVKRDDVAFLRFVAPDFERAHAGLFDRNLGEVERGALAGKVGKLGHGVGEAARADVVNGDDRIFVAHGPAAVDDFLGTAFHFGVAALHGVEVEGFGVGACRHGRGGAAAEADAHAGAAEDDQEAAGGRHVLLRLVVADVADAAGEHDRLVVAVARAADVGFERAEVAEDVRTAELVVEGGAAERAFRHDRERRGDAGRGAVLGIRLFTRHRVGVVFKTLRKFRQVEVRGREAAQAGLRTSTAARRTFVADFAAGARGGAGERRNGSRVVVGLDLEDRVGHFVLALEDAAEFIAGARTRIEARDFGAFEDGGVVGVGRDRTLRGHLVRAADHAEERFLALFTVDRPAGVEDLVAAVLGVGLREHHQLDVGRVAADLREGVGEVVDLVGRERKAHLDVGALKGGTTFLDEGDGRHRTAFELDEEVFGREVAGDDGFGHAVMKHAGGLSGLLFREGSLEGKAVDRAALDAQDAFDAAVLHDVRGLRGPGRDRAKTRHHHEGQVGADVLGGVAVGEKRSEAFLFGLRELAGGMHEMHEAARDRFDVGRDALQGREHARGAEVRERAGAVEFKNHTVAGRHKFPLNRQQARIFRRP